MVEGKCDFHWGQSGGGGHNWNCDKTQHGGNGCWNYKLRNLTLTLFLDRFATLLPRSCPPSRPRPAVPTSGFPSRTPARPPRPSTAGSCSAPSSSLRTSRRRRRLLPCAATLAPSAALRKVRTNPHESELSYICHQGGEREATRRALVCRLQELGNLGTNVDNCLESSRSEQPTTGGNHHALRRGHLADRRLDL